MNMRDNYKMIWKYNDRDILRAYLSIKETMEGMSVGGDGEEARSLEEVLTELICKECVGISSHGRWRNST